MIDITKKELEAVQRLALIHYKKGDRISYPQLEVWELYQGEKYCVGDQDGVLATTRPKIALDWTPHKDVAEEVVLRFKQQGGWKFNDICVLIVTNELLKTRKIRPNTFAGFSTKIVARGGEEIVIIPRSPEVEAELGKS
jgi:hypothetical protein